MNDAMRSILENLRDGPKTTLHLQRFCGTTHAAKPIWDLRQAGYVIARKSLPNRVALYSLISEPDAPVEAGARAPVAASPRAPVFGDMAAHAFVSEGDRGARSCRHTDETGTYNCHRGIPQHLTVDLPWLERFLASTRAPVPEFGDVQLIRAMRR